MSVWSGIAAAGVAIALAFVAVGQPVWEWRLETSTQRDLWSYGVFGVHHTVFNKTSNVLTVDRTYDYGQLASLSPGPPQPNMARAFADFEQFFVLGLIAAFGGLVLSILTAWRRLRGIFAGVAFLGACGLLLYASFAIVFTVPPAATADLNPFGTGIPEFRGQTTGGLSWTPLWGWGLVIGGGLGFAWASSDLWHIVPSKKLVPAKVDVTIKRVPAPARPPPPPPPVEIRAAGPPEPVIEEVFVIGSNGLLVKHMSRSLMSDKDRDVVGSMISAISSFVREAFTERDGEVHEVTLGDHRFVMCNDAGLVVAVLVTSGETEDIVHRLRHLLAVLRDRYGERLVRWAGEPLEGIEDELAVLWEPYHVPPPPAA